MSQVKLVTECFIRPQHEVNDSKRKYYLGAPDLRRLSLGYMQYGLLFSKPFATDSPSKTQLTSPTILPLLLEQFQLSISLSLDHFYPFAGQMVTERVGDEHASCIYIDCHKGPGAKLIIATALDLTISDIATSNADVRKVVEMFFDMGERSVNFDGHTRPLGSVQITELADGLFMGCCINHSVCDGTSFTHCVNVWSQIFMGTPESQISRKPILNYKPNQLPENSSPCIKLPYLEPKEFIARAEEHQLRERIFHFSPTSMTNLKKKVNVEASTENISFFQALSALVWRAIIRARKLPLNEGTTYAMAIDLRPRLSPSLSPDYFGNFIRRASLTVKVSELLANSVSWAALLIHQVVQAQDEKVARDELLKPYLEGGTVEVLKNLSSGQSNTVWMGGAIRFDVSGLECGLGKPLAVRSGYSNKEDGKLRLIGSPHGDGSVDLEVCLESDTMAALLSDEDFMNFIC